MSATSLIKLTQNAVTGTSGHAVTGTIALGVVTVENDSNTGVASWEIELLDVPSGSALTTGLLAHNDNSATPSATFTPDQDGGCYRIALRVWNAINRVGTATDTDIRNFVVLNVAGFASPPDQIYPSVLPATASGLPGNKPNELNLGGQERGYAGAGTDGLLDNRFKFPFTADGLRETGGPTIVVMGGVADGQLLMRSSTNWTGTTFPTQTNQTVGLYGVGNTTQNSSTTRDARSISFDGLGIVTVGFSNGSVQISATTVQSVQTVGFYGVGNTTQNSSTTLDARTISFDGLGAASVGFSNGSVQISVPAVVAQTNQTIGYYAVGNTTQNSSTTLDARTVSFDGLGAATVGFSNGSVQISVPVQTAQTQSNIQAVYDGVNSISTGTIRFTNANGVSFSVNGQTLSASIAPRKIFQLASPENPWQTNFSISNASFSLQHFNPRADITATQANLLMALSGNTGSTGALTISLGIYTMAGSTISLASSDSRQITWTSGSSTTASSVYGGISGTCYRTVALNSWGITAGDYLLGMWFRTTNDGTWRAFGQQGPTIVNAVDANETNIYANGFSTSSYSTAMIASINLTNTNYVRTGVNALQQPGVIFLGTF